MNLNTNKYAGKKGRISPSALGLRERRPSSCARSGAESSWSQSDCWAALLSSQGESTVAERGIRLSSRRALLIAVAAIDPNGSSGSRFGRAAVIAAAQPRASGRPSAVVGALFARPSWSGFLIKAAVAANAGPDERPNSWREIERLEQRCRHGARRGPRRSSSYSLVTPSATGPRRRGFRTMLSSGVVSGNGVGKRERANRESSNAPTLKRKGTSCLFTRVHRFDFFSWRELAAADGTMHRSFLLGERY